MNKEATRDAFGRAIVRLAKKNKDIIALDCDLGRSTRSYRITEVDKDRFFEMGIAEQDMVSTAAGLSSMGKITLVNTFAIFLVGRAYDQIRQQVALPKSNVKLCGSSAGITQGPDGATHQSVTDINLMRGLPNMTVLVPTDGNQTEEIVEFAIKYKGPIYIRLSRYETPPLLDKKLKFQIGKIQEVKKGNRIAVLTCGPILNNCLKAVDLLQTQGVEPGIYNVPSIKPLDISEIKNLVSDYDYLLTVEEHNIIGGLGSAVAEILSELKMDKLPVLKRIGVKDCYGESGTPDELLKKHGLDAEGIQNSILNLINL